MEQLTGLLQRVNLATRDFHADVDAPWLDLLRPGVGIHDYLSALVRTYGLVAPFESACRYTTGLARVVDFKQLMRAGLIAQDLLALGLSALQVATIPTCPALSIFRSIPEALGWLYVVERFTLLHDGVRRHLRQHLAIEHASAYLHAYEGNVAHHWAAFGQVLDRVGHDEETADEIVQASLDAFQTCRQWLRNTRIERSAG